MRSFKKLIAFTIFLVLGLFILGIALIYAFGGMFFAAVPAAYGPVAYISEKAGYELQCADLHDNWRCKVSRPKVEQANASADASRDSWNTFQCDGVGDCVPLKTGGCGLKHFSFWQADPDSKLKCVCLSGPTIQGCVPADQVPPNTPEKEPVPAPAGVLDPSGTSP